MSRQLDPETLNIISSADVVGAGQLHQCELQQAASFAAQGVIAGAYDVVIACGVELMSQNPIGSSTVGADPYGERIGARYPGGLIGQGVSAAANL